jgi:GNAT superfamily N-acetyltransferase
MTVATVRDADLADIATIVAFNQQLASETEGRHLERDVLEAGVAALLRDPARGRYFVAEVPHGTIVGQVMITFEWSDWRNGAFWWIQSVYIAPGWRRQGVFRRLFEHIDALSRRAPAVCGLRLYVDRSNARAQATYLKCGLDLTQYLLMECDRSAASHRET